ncbi:MAG: class II aldolase/adducin family protein, partial [Algicola sp.]|nr:class II aldolase/adducin family protein [Algicola sp.]
MKSFWDSSLAPAGDLNLRVYTSRLLGMDDSLVLHGGGNTSVKSSRANVFGEQQQILYIKGSGCDLKTIEPQNFAPLDLNHLLKLAELETLSDIDMVRELRCAMTDPTAPSPSIETIVHASIPCKFIDHTHADAVVTLSNTPNGEQTLKQLYGDRVLILPFAKPGFVLARQIHQAIKDIDLAGFEGIVLLNHGIFTFADDAKSAYQTMIKLVSEAEDHIKNQDAWQVAKSDVAVHFDPLDIAKMRKRLSQLHGSPMIVKWHNDSEAIGFSALENLAVIANQGPITPDHVIQTKPVPMIIKGTVNEKNNKRINDAITAFEADYRQYFTANAREEHTLLDCAPRVAIAPNQGIFTMATNAKRCNAVADIYRQTMKAIQWAEKLGGWQPLGKTTLFEMEYWSLEQAKLKTTAAKPEFEGKIAFITGAASGIGKSTAMDLLARGACVVATDISPTVVDMIDDPACLGVVWDVAS